MSLHSDIKFAQANMGEFNNSISPMLRYVAAINTDCTRKEFIDACVAAGFKANTAGNRFRESRKETLSIDGGRIDREGRHIL